MSSWTTHCSDELRPIKTIKAYKASEIPEARGSKKFILARTHEKKNHSPTHEIFILDWNVHSRFENFILDWKFQSQALFFCGQRGAQNEKAILDWKFHSALQAWLLSILPLDRGWTYKLPGGQNFSIKISPLSVGFPQRRPLSLIKRPKFINSPGVRFINHPASNL